MAAKKKRKKKKKKGINWYFFTIGLILIPMSLLLFLILINFLEISFKCGNVEIFLWGFLTYIPIHFILGRPYFMHVAAHEFSHAFFAKLFFGKIYELHIDSEDSGSVTMSRKNIIINLAPYFFPLYSTLLISIYMIVKNNYKPYFAFVAGLLLSIHYMMNLRDLQFKQPDIIQSGGKIFSFPFIATLNFLIFILFIYILSNYELDMGDFYYAVDRIVGTITNINLFNIMT